MPFGCLFKKENTTTMSDKDRRAKLGLKVVMAQQNPEPVYDLTNCAMLELPPDTFVMCRLLQKTVLLLQDNSLMSFEKGGKLHELEGLEFLDLTNNKFAHLPDSVNKLKNLRILKLSNNKLKNLPMSISELTKLKELYLSSNKLSKVPVCICALPSLQVLSLTGNNISVLPKEFCNLQNSLCKLEIDTDKLQSPPPAVAAEGTEAIMRYLCEEHGIAYEGICEAKDDLTECASPHDYSKMESSAGDQALRSYMCRKDEKVKAQLAVEEEFQAKEQEQLAHMLQDMSNNKQHLLAGIFETPVEAMEYERKKLKAMQEHGIAYEGICEAKDDLTECASPHDYSKMESSAGDQALRSYMCRKDEKVKAQLAVEEEFQAKEQEQLAHMLQDMSNNKQHLLAGIFETPVEAMEYERKKLKAMQEQYNIEENVRAEQAEQLEKYLELSNNKESLIYDITTQQANMDLEMEGLVTAKEKDRQSLLKDLATTEQETAAAVQELVNSTASRRSDGFLCLLKDQEVEMQSLLSGIVEAASELRHSEVVAAMKAVLVEAAAAEQRRLAVQEEQGARVCALLEEADLVDSHLKGVLTSRLADQEEWASTLLKDEECQAAAFRLLLLKSDLHRNNILRQIGQIEYELYRLSSMEVRKRKYGIKYGSSTMLEQRATLVGLLKSLLTEKSEREAQLMAWIVRLEESRTSDVAEEEFWLVQYQRLLSMKPAGLAEAEAQLEPKVREVLCAANALDLAPVFAHSSVTFSALMDLTEEDASVMGIGPATYRSLQRALQSHLSASKLENQTPSAPLEEDLPFAPSAPEMADKREAPSAPPDEGGETVATAPPVEGQFVEAECVVCINSICEVVFLPCGHVCACAKCCTPLLICPMCRSPIISKILLTY